MHATTRGCAELEKKLPKILLKSHVSSPLQSSGRIPLVNFCDLHAASLLWKLTVKTDNILLWFSFDIADHKPGQFTKRQVLAHVMRIFDPLGILAPTVVRGRIMFQDLWRRNLQWDERLSEADQELWSEWFESLRDLVDVRVPRCYSLSNYIDLELHTFCDASELAHAAVAYWRLILPSGSFYYPGEV